MLRKIINFFFDSAYEVVTWVWIGLSIGSFFFFAGKPEGQGGRGMMWSVISLCLSVAVMMLLLAKRYFFDAEDKPARVTVDIGNTTDPRNPFHTRFILTNSNPDSIYKVDAKGEAWNPVLRAPINLVMSADIDAIHELPANGRFSINPSNLGVAILLMPEPPQTVVFQLRIKYIYKTKEETASFRFTAERKNDGTCVWLPMDPATDIDQVLREMAQRTNRAINAKFQDRARLEVETVVLDKPFEIGKPPPNVHIVLRNVGGQTAKNSVIYFKTMVGPGTPSEELRTATIDVPRPEPGHCLASDPLIAQGVVNVDDRRVPLLKSGKYKLYVSGRAEYDSGATSHKTEFCYINVSGTTDFQPCHVGNAAT